MLDFKLKIRVRNEILDATYDLIVKAESSNDAIKKVRYFIVNSFKSYNYLISEPEPILFDKTGIAVYFSDVLKIHEEKIE